MIRAVIRLSGNSSLPNAFETLAQGTIWGRSATHSHPNVLLNPFRVGEIRFLASRRATPG